MTIFFSQFEQQSQLIYTIISERLQESYPKLNATKWNEYLKTMLDNVLLWKWNLLVIKHSSKSRMRILSADAAPHLDENPLLIDQTLDKTNVKLFKNEYIQIKNRWNRIVSQKSNQISYPSASVIDLRHLVLCEVVQSFQNAFHLTDQQVDEFSETSFDINVYLGTLLYI